MPGLTHAWSGALQLPRQSAYLGLMLLAYGDLIKAIPVSYAPPLLNSEWLESPEGLAKLSKCLPIEQLPTEGKNLTAKEIGLLSTLCWRGDLVGDGQRLSSVSRGIPRGVNCNVTKWYAHKAASEQAPPVKSCQYENVACMHDVQEVLSNQSAGRQNHAILHQCVRSGMVKHNGNGDAGAMGTTIVRKSVRGAA